MALRFLSMCPSRVAQKCVQQQPILLHSAQRPARWQLRCGAAAAGSDAHVSSDTSSARAGEAAEASSSQEQAAKQQLMWPKMQSKFCRLCGGQMQIIQPDGDREWRHVCKSCGYIDYFNPKMVVGCVVQHEDKILLCRRGIEPCKGLWTIPAGFMEIGESSAAGAARETLEEANAAVQIVAPYAHWDIPIIGQAYILFRAQLAAPYTFSAGPESLDVALFEPDSIPFDEIAFSSVGITLRHFIQDMASGSWHMHHGVIHKRQDAAPNDPAAFELRDHFAVSVK